MRPHGIGVDPGSLVGKQLTSVRRSRAHPCITLQFSDGTSYQILVVGYDPHYRGIPKVLESDSPILNPRGSNGTADVRLTVSHATSITLSDKAFQIRSGPKSDASTSIQAASLPREDRWTQRHAAFALKFEEEQGWHCVSAVMVEYDDRDKERCVFRNYADVYVDKLHTVAPPPASAPARVTSHQQFADPASPGPGHQKSDQKPKRRGGKKKAGGKLRW
ncbi:hypothetical protein DICSQDRAFT_152535 [Dichomitus squalens LYAD-421 SS1]|uniref:uncharacterized protein n=1 Tax=Dichomitus squalens (strain LYAD-421) TaxID=732165 RepID=UPI000441121E|nr:uncharacterized protein DICSQDRAFT_152535 [Dichomitus squalens LYAD-421 SS1]EJF65307.1 hypothetical protein DICSQDRAFT_152535 [Dichomitus squalens LYAD-421 SS1]